MIAAVADRAEMSKADAKRALATKKRTGRNPATGEEITIAAKPSSVDVRARPVAKAKAALPSVQKARRRLAAANARTSR
jgi:nucleoid DNA-binding protein